MKKLMRNKAYLLVPCLLLFAACGGGGGGVSNSPPSADAGTDQAVDSGVTVNLDGSGSSDSDGTIASFSWTQTAGTAVTLNNADTATPSFSAPNTSEVLSFDLTVTDNAGATDTDTVDVTVTLTTGTFTKTVDGGADNGDNSFPFTDTNSSQILHQLYLASEINGAGFINRLSFRYSLDVASAVVCPNMTVKLGHTSLTNLTPTFANNVEQGKGSQVTVINDATVTIQAGTAGSYFDVPLANAFDYNGVDNLVVEFVRNAACTGEVKIDTMTSSLRQVNAQPIAATTLSGSLSLRFTKFHFAGGDNEKNFGGTTSNAIPFSNQTPRAQFLYLASEIDGSGPITGLAFQKGFAVSTAQTYTATIMMGHSTLATLGNTFATNYSDTPVTVANAVTFNIPADIPIGEWFWVPLPDGPFSYNGSDNLIVDVTTSAGTSITFVVQGVIAGRRVFNFDNTATFGNVDSGILHAKLRFNGGTMDVITDAIILSGVPVGSGSEFIVQTLYDSTALGTGGQITSLGFRLGVNANAFDHMDVNLVLGHTTLSALGAASLAANIQSDRTAAFSGTISIPAGLKAGDWVQVPLSTPFTYDPTQNLVVQWDVPGFATTNNSMGHTTSTSRYVGHLEGNVGDRTSDVSNTSVDSVLDMRLILNK